MSVYRFGNEDSYVQGYVDFDIPDITPNSNIEIIINADTFSQVISRNVKARANYKTHNKAPSKYTINYGTFEWYGQSRSAIFSAAISENEVETTKDKYVSVGNLVCEGTTSRFFSAVSNKTKKSITGTFFHGSASVEDNLYDAATSWAYDEKPCASITLTLDAPPSFDYEVLSSGNYYKTLSTYEVEVSNSSAKYGGDIIESKLQIGDQIVYGVGDTILTIPLMKAGRFTPTISVTDSRGQTTLESLNPITVADYSAPEILETSVTRCNSSGIEEDDGVYAQLSVKHTYSNDNAQLEQPIVTMDNADISSNVNWYTTESGSRTEITFPYSGTGNETIYGIVGGSLDPTLSYSLSVHLQDSLGGESKTLSLILPQGFYTMDIKAGGHGIAFGAPALEDIFKVAMPAKFTDAFAVEQMAGFIQMYAGTTEPIGWKFCNGQTVKQSDYPLLYSAIGTTYNDGTESSGYFRLPDFQDRFPVGAGNDYAVNAQGGKAEVELTIDTMPSHNHTQNQHRHEMYGNWSTGSGSTTAYMTSANRTATTRYTDYTTPTINNRGGGKAHENRPPYIGINFIICTGSNN